MKLSILLSLFTAAAAFTGELRKPAVRINVIAL
jgi:hypothetical protein